jgi:hypothetical protein
LADFCLFIFPSGKKPNRKLSGAVAESCHRLFLVTAIVIITVHYLDFAIALNQVPDTVKVLYSLRRKFKGGKKKVPSHHHHPEKRRREMMAV